MAPKDILTMVLSTEQDEPAIALGETLSDYFEAGLTAMFLTALPDEPLSYEPGVVAGIWSEMLTRAREDGALGQAALKGRLMRSRPGAQLRAAEAFGRDLGRMAAVHARYSDIAILARPADPVEGALRLDMIEGVLFHSGRPVIVAPPGWKPDGFGRRIAIGWDASREATRALAEARPFLARCEKAAIITVDAKPKAFGHGDQPGLNIACHLERRGVSVEVRNVERGQRTVGEALLSQAEAMGASLLVMGAYAQSRWREMVFGGATRDLLERSTLPLLMAH